MIFRKDAERCKKIVKLMPCVASGHPPRPSRIWYTHTLKVNRQKEYDRRRKCAMGVLHLLLREIESSHAMREQRWPLSMILVSVMGKRHCVTRRRAFSGAFKAKDHDVFDVRWQG